jgi:putrescine aminotransferase
VRGQGAHVWDNDGRKILDGMAGLWCVNVGYGRQELADAAYDQMLELPTTTTFFQSDDAADDPAGAKIAWQN